MEGFGASIQRAVRVDEEHDWSTHYVDYRFFKQRLLVFSERRAKLRTLLRDYEGTIRSDDFEHVIAGLLSYEEARKQARTEPPPARAGRRGDGMVGFTLSIPQNDELQSENTGAGTIEMPPVMPSASPRDYGEATQGYVKFTESSSTDGIGSIGSNALMKGKAVMRRISKMERTELLRFLDEETQKAAALYRAQLAWLSQAAAGIKGGFYPDDGTGSENSSSYTFVGNEILEMFAFVTINVATVRQILIRYDAFVRTFGGTPMSTWYFKKARSSKVSAFWFLLNHTQLLGLADSFKEIVLEVHGLEEDEDGFFRSATHAEGGYSPDGYIDTNADFLNNFAAQVDMFKHILAKTHRSASKAASGQIVKRDNFVLALRDYFLLGSLSDNLGLQPKFLTMRGKSLNREMKVLADWRDTKTPSSSDAWSVFSEGIPKLSFKQAFPLLMNLISILFFMMNYYIVEPSSTKYVNALGCNDAMSGLLIGAMPWAVLLSSVVYSYWTNYSFKTPLLAAGLLLISGNLLYASAYGRKSIAIALSGRFMTGLGGTKVINRRFVADTTPMATRTAVNAAFGMALTVGVALGPATAVRLDMINAEFDLPYVGTVYMNGMTNPGFLMATLWSVFWLVILFAFEEPEREGLEEQKQKERSSSKVALVDRTPSEAGDYMPHLADSEENERKFVLKQSNMSQDAHQEDMDTIYSHHDSENPRPTGFFAQVQFVLGHITGPLRICMFLFFAKMFTAESLISVTSALTKNRYGWQVKQVGTLGCINGLLMVPLSVVIGFLSQFYQDRVLMQWLITVAIFGMFLLIDISDLISAENDSYNEGHVLAVSPPRYVTGYFITFGALQALDSIIASTMSKVIPTALASGTLNSGLLTTLVGTLGSALGDVFISTVGFISLRQLMNLLFIPSCSILILCLIIVKRNWDILAA